MAGPPDESGQALQFEVESNSNKTLFAAQPKIDANGTLSYVPALNASGMASVAIVDLMDPPGAADVECGHDADTLTWRP